MFVQSVDGQVSDVFVQSVDGQVSDVFVQSALPTMAFILYQLLPSGKSQRVQLTTAKRDKLNCRWIRHGVRNNNNLSESVCHFRDLFDISVIGSMNIQQC